jgi:hypothetical protein
MHGNFRPLHITVSMFSQLMGRRLTLMTRLLQGILTASRTANFYERGSRGVLDYHVYITNGTYNGGVARPESKQTDVFAGEL